MELKKNHESKLWIMFMKYLIAITLATLVLILISFEALLKCINAQIFLPANYAENYLNANMEKIRTSEPFDKTLVPNFCKYGLFDKSYHYIEGNFNNQELGYAWSYFSTEQFHSPMFYKVITRKNEICIIQYDLKIHFANDFLNQLFPNPEITFIYLLLLCILIIFFLLAFYFAKQLKKQLLPLIKAAEKIQEKDLDFNMSYCKIKEFNDVLHSMDEMKNALSTSLKREWLLEEKKNSHISSLAHDIKTPLTIIKGNAQLLLEEDLPEDLKEYVMSIDGKTDVIENYIKLLIQTAQSKMPEGMSLKTINLASWIEDISKEALSLGKTKEVKIKFTKTHIPLQFYTDPIQLSRAVMNIIKNGIEHTNPYHQVTLNFIGYEKHLEIIIEDEGKGFSSAALKYGTDQFFTESQARLDNHYGLGLYIADTIVKNLHGTLTLYNKSDKGAVVKLSLPFLLNE